MTKITNLSALKASDKKILSKSDAWRFEKKIIIIEEESEVKYKVKCCEFKF